MLVRVGYPDLAAEREILALARSEASRQAPSPRAVVSRTVIAAARQEVLAVHMAPNVEEYIVQLVIASRHPGKYAAKLAGWIEYGASPRATIALDRCARALAWLRGRDFVSPDDVQAVVHDILRHRLIVSFEAAADGIVADQIIDALLEQVPVT